MSNRIFSMFTVNDYKGGELSSSPNMSLDQVLGGLVECGAFSHPNLEHSSDVWDKTDDEIREIIKECSFDEEAYASSDDGWCGELFEHVDNELTCVDPKELQPLLADYIIAENNA